MARVLLGRQIETPWILVDELLYSELAKSLVEHGELLIRDLKYGDISYLYPALIAPAWLADSMETTYGVAKSIGSLLMCLAAVPVYLWARRLVSPLWALVAVSLVLLLPAFVYTGTLMTENAFFPAFVLALYAFALALERPTLATQAFALGTAAIACTARFQGVVLFAVFVVAVGLKVLLDRLSTRQRLWPLVRPYAPSLGLLGGLAIAYVGWKLAQGADLASGLGAYSGVGAVEYSEGEAARWVARHFGELALALGVAPVAALLVLTGLAVRPGLPAPAERAFVAVAVSAVTLLVVEVGVFASRFALRIEERNMIHVAPALILAFVLWLARGLPRPPILASAAAVGSAALLLLIPLQTVLNPSILSDTFSLIPLLRVDEALSGGIDRVRLAMLAGGAAMALAFLFAPRRYAAVGLPLLLAAYFAIATNSVQGALEDYSRNLRGLVPPEPSWIDARVGADTDVPYLYGSTVDPFREAVALWELEFWNRSVAGVYSLGVANPAGIPQLEASFDRARGTIASADPALRQARHVVAPEDLDVVGRPLARDAERVLYEVDPPLRVETSVGGVYADGWTGADATYDRYEGSPGTLTVSLSRKNWPGEDKPGRVRIEVGPLQQAPDGAPQLARTTATRSWTIHSGEARTFRLPTPAAPFRAAIHVEPTFSPADYGGPDTRQLGAQVTFAFKPAR